MRPLADAVARDVAMYDQQGCLSPQQVYLVESGVPAPGPLSPGPTPPSSNPGPAALPALAFARLLGESLTRLADRWPVPPRELGVRVAIRRARETHRIRRLVESGAATGGGSERETGPWLPTALTGPADRFGWTLLATGGRSPQLGPGGRTLLLTRVATLDEAVDAIRPLGPLIQGVALHAPRERDRLAGRLAGELAVPYLCRPGELQRPPFGWRNDNVPALRSLLV